MKKCIFSAIGGAIAMLVVIVIAANIHASREQELQEYEHIDYVSQITQAKCYICGDSGDSVASAYWGQDNVGLINLNNFELLHLEINRYEGREMIEEPAGVMLSCGLSDTEAETYAHAYIFPDNAYASIQITGVQYAINRDSVQSHLCQDCLDSINDLWFTTQPPAEFAVVSFEDKTIHPLLNANPWFASGNYGVDCEFKEDGAIDLLIHYCPFRYK